MKRLVTLMLLVGACLTAQAQETSATLLHDLDAGVRFMGVTTMITSALLLAFTNRGRISSGVYSRSRILMIISTVLLGTLMLGQFVGHFRERSQCLSWAISLLVLSVALTSIGLGQMNLLRAGHKMKLPVLKVITFILSCYVITIIGYYTGYLINDDAPWKSATAIVALLFTLKLVRMMRIIFLDTKKVRVTLNDEELEMRQRVLKYTSVSATWVLALSLISPWIGLVSYPFVHTLHGFVMFGLMTWYVASFIIYGNKMDEVISLEDEIRETLETKDPETPDSKEDDQLIAEKVEAWIASKAFSDPSISIDLVSKNMGLTPGTLSRFLSDHYDIKYRNWISHLRIEYAKELMVQNPNYSIQAISDLCGFKDRTAFQRTFAQYVGMPPRQWANANEGIKN